MRLFNEKFDMADVIKGFTCVRSWNNIALLRCLKQLLSAASWEQTILKPNCKGRLC